MRKKRNGKKLRSALAILLAGSMMLGMVPSGMGQVYAADAETPVKEEQTGILDKAKDFFSDMGEGIADFFTGGSAEVEPAAAFDETSIVDEETSQGWRNIVENTTQNIGRIWTDKSVYNSDVILPGIGEGGQEILITKPETSDFMVGLSALSSTSNTSVTTSTPLDIVLVLDVSGSMGENLGTTYVYKEAYNISEDGTEDYYALDQNGKYVKIKRVTTGWGFWERFDHWELNGVTVVPKTQNDNNPDHIQFYTYGIESKMDALKTAVNGFIDATAKQNESIIDTNKQHHISVVKYAGTKRNSVGDDKYQDGSYRYNYSQIVSNLTDDMSGLKSKVDNLDSAGATSADYGMQHANSVLNPEAGHGARQNTQKVVVMFTDGEPNHESGFSTTVATDAIESAKTLKDAGALVYTIGVVRGADPNESIDTSKGNNLNAYLHSVSSNYPTAQGYVRNGWKNEWVMGDREPNSNYYKAATNSEELNNIFQEISQEINSGTGYPTDTEEGFENRDGYVTFHDQLGDYMQVDSFNTLVLNDITFSAEPTKAEGKIKYTYSGEVDLNGDGKKESVSNIVITVTPGTGSMGDTVDVSIPATLLPLRNFKVDITEKTMTVEDKYPLRLFYNVSLKEEVKNSLANPDREMKNYIAANSEKGNVYFYSNKFTGSKQGPTDRQTLGDTTATFEPASGNSFYYFTENTPLWLDENMTEAVTIYNADREVYYYEKTYYKLENGAPKEVKEAVSFRSHPQDEVRDWVGTATNGQLYIKAGAPRLTRIHDLTDSKENPIPGTATEVITPNWDNEQNQRFIEVSLGNNGRLAVELPGTLEIKKTVTSEVKAPEKEFKFRLSMTNKEGVDLTGEFDAQKFDALGNESGNIIKVRNADTITLKHDESIKIYGLSNGDKYNIEEIDIPAGFTATKNPITGTIAGNETVTAAFENTYAVTPAVLEGESSIRAQKVLNGRDWENGDSFEFVLRPVSGEAPPLPEPDEKNGTRVEGGDMIKVVKDGNIFSFGEMTFTKPGTYQYVIFEKNPGAENALPGVSYSRARYRIDIVVTDNGEGKLSATSTMLKRADDLGQEILDDEIVDAKIAVLTNTFKAESVLWGVRGNKVYTDYSDAKPLEKDMFEFQIEPVVNEEYTEPGPLPEGKGSNALSGQINFGSVECGDSYNGKTYLYKITEIVPEGVTSENPTKDGMTYDTRVYYLKVSFGYTEKPDGSTIMTATSEYLKENMEPIPNMTEFVFENEYRPDPVTIGEDADTAIKGSKTLNGRAMTEGEFSFELTARNDAAIKGLADDSIKFGEDTASESVIVKAPATAKDVPSEFNFGKITFTKPGTYEFNIKEIIPEQNAGGMTYDTHTEVVTVKVTDNNGVLTAQTIYDNDDAAFVNTYKASHNYVDDGGALVTKTLNGRDMKVNEFQFTITGTGANAEESNKKLAEADKDFKNYAQRDGVASEMPKLQNLQFTEKDAGKTFTYLIDEVMPKEADRAGGVTYDQSEFTLAIAVTDNGNGTMSTTTTVTRIKASDGTVANEVLGVYTSGGEVVSVPFVNTYKAAPVIVDTSDIEGDIRLRKVLQGRDWTENDSFTFTMAPKDNAPMPEENPEAGITLDENGNLQAVVTADAGTKAGERVYFGFGSITYDKAGTYVYTVTENTPETPLGGMTYSENVVTITVRITDPGTGKLEKYVGVNGTINNRTFYNVYAASLNHNAAGGIVTKKTLTGHALVKDQFTFKVEALAGKNTTAEENAKRIGLTNVTSAEYTNIADEDNDGIVVMKTQDDHAIVFTSGDIGKTFKYQFSEKGANGEFGTGGKEAGYTYDDTVYTVELWVTDDLDGTLTLHTKVTGKDDSVISEGTSDETNQVETILAFNNSYAATGELDGNTKLEVTKNLQGRDWLDSDSFSFKLEATGETAQAVEDKIVTLPKNAQELVINGSYKDKKASFGNIGFTKPGTYTFKVTEVVPEGAVNNVLNGITYDSSVKNITVNVTDNNAGELIAAVAEGSDALTFTNTYATSTVTLGENEQFKVTKNLVGREWTETDAFEFTLTAKEGVPMPVDGRNVVTATTDARTQTFGTITYTAAGTYEYQITEKVPENPEEGMTYDRHPATVTVKVEENKATGTLSIESVTYSDGANGAQFTNVLGNNTKEVTSGNENVNNGMVGVGDELTYVINWVNDGVDKTGAPAAATVTVTDKIPEGTEYVADSATEGVVYDTDARTLTWTIEAEAAATGSVSFTVRVTGTVSGENIKNQAGIQVGKNDPKVTNEVETFIPGKDSVVEDDGELQVGSVLTYTISYKNPEVDVATVTITDEIPDGLDYVEGSAGEYAVYDADNRTLTWTLENVPAGEIGTVTFQASVNENAVEKVDNKATIQIGENDPKYETNTDSKPVPKSGALAISKTIALTAGQGTVIDTKQIFTFTVALKDAKGVALTKEYGYIVTGESGEEIKKGNATDGTEISFQHGQKAVITGLPAGAQYTVTEKEVDGYTTSVNGQAGNVASGTITANTTATTDFTNTYSVTGDLTGAESLKVTKNFTGREGNKWLEGDAFTFTLTAADDEATKAAIKAGLITLPDPAEITINSTTEGKQAAFGNITFNIVGTFKFNVTEQESNIAGVTDDANRVREIVVNVVDNKDGTLTATIADESDNLTFTNVYKASGNLTGAENLKVTKNFTGREGNKWLESDAFTFTLTAADDEATQNAIEEKLIKLPKATEITIDSKTEGKQAAFGNITFSTAGTFKFNVTEQKSNIAGVTDDAKPVRKIVVNVVDNGNGTLTATVVADESDNLTFTNVYKASSIGLGEDKQFKVTKNLVGREWTEGDAFEFTLTAKDGAPMPAEGGNVVIATNAEKTKKFGEITYDAAGTYEYQITEKVPETPEEGMTYDTHTATVTVKVTEDYATGTLSIKSVTYSDGADATEAQFTNVVGNNTKDVQNAEGGSLNNGTVGVGDELTYVINWVNDGVDETGAPAAATVKITDKIPEGTEYVADSATEGAVYDKDARTLTWTIKAEAAQTGSVSFKVVVTDKAGGTEIANTGEITVGKNDPKVTNTVETTVPGKKETTNPDKIEEGTILTYEIKFRNTDGDGAAAEVVDNMTPGLEYQLGTATVNDQVSDPEVEGDAATGQTLTWNLEGLAENAEVTIRFNVKVTRDALESVDNSATVNGHKSNVVTTPYPSDDKKSVADASGNNQDNGMVGVGDELTYTIDWAAEDAGKVIITDVVPKGTEFVEASKGGELKDGTVTWTIDNVKKGQKGSVNFTVRVTGTVSGENIKNQASIKVGDRDPKVTNEVETFIPGKDSVVEGNGELQVGSVLTYTISYKNPESAEATVTITDKIPEGLDYVEGSASNNASYDAETRILTWTLENVPAGADGTVTFRASVNENAVEKVENKATIQIGENNPKYETNTDSKPVPKSGGLAISKTIALTEGQGTKIDTEKAFEFTVALTDSAGVPLTKEYAYTIGNKDGKVAHNGKILLKHGETATITGLPAGTKFTVTETAADGYTSSPASGVITDSVTAGQIAKADFTNTYSVTGNLTGAESLKVTKNFTGREGNQWLESDVFTFTLTAADHKATQDAIEAGLITLPDPAEITINSTTEGKQAAFGNITFNIAGTFKFNVTEQESNIAGVTDDANRVREIVVNVVDNKNGTLTATIEEGSNNLTFTNTYGAGSGEEDIAAKIQATKKLTGRDMKADEFTFEVVTRAVEGVEGFTETVVATGTNVAGADGEAAQVTFAGSDANGPKALTYTTKSLNEAVEAGYATKEGNEWTVNYTAREKTDSLPKGVTPVEGKTEFNFTIVVTDNTDGTLTAEVIPEGGIAFENTYATGGTDVNTDPTEATAYFNKKLTGRDWLDTDVFTFTITPKDGAPAPEGVAEDGTKTVTVTSNSAKADALVPFGFGTIRFTDAHMEGATPNDDGTVSKTFTYDVTEVIPEDGAKIPGITYDGHTATLEITVTDNLQGELSATAAITTENGTFTNTYRSNLEYHAVGGLQITKVLHGRDMEAEQFTFGIGTNDPASAEKFGLEVGKVYELKNKAAEAEAIDTIDVLAGKKVIFTQADAGKTFTYEVSEKPGENEAYTYDTDVRTVTINVRDNNNGTLTVVTTVKKGETVVDEKTVITGQAGQKATVAFENTYNDNPATLGGEGTVSIKAKKSLTNRPMEADEFTFKVLDNKDNVVTTGTNGSDGIIRFGAIEYTTDKLIADAKAGIATVDKTTSYPAYVYTYDYDVVEDESNFVDGVTGITKAFAIEVVVTDDGNGNLSIRVVYPEGMEELLFENAYGTSAEAEINVNGSKKLVVESGNNAPDITGKYTFTISGVEEGTENPAPMPENNNVVNDKSGNVNFGKIRYTMENVFGNEEPQPLALDESGAEAAEDEIMPIKSPERTKTFVYTVTESGNVPGVHNDPEAKTFTITVKDYGNGTISVMNTENLDFTFTNKYNVDPVDYNISTDLSIKKELSGRELREGEFTFELVNEAGEVVATATNTADGTVAFKTSLTYTAPGAYNYVIREQKGEAGGVQYDSAEHTVTVVVTDNGDGTLSAKAETKSKAEIVFKNIYETTPASVTLGASKIYKGAELKDKQFTFELRDQNGEGVSEAKNGENGQVAFETITFDEVGTYKYTISEKNDKQKNVTYDKAVYEVTVTVTDNGEGSLIAEVAYADGKAPVFTNKYTKPAEPSKPEEPKEPGAVQTGDSTPIVGLVVAMVVALAAIVAVAVIFFRRRRR